MRFSFPKFIYSLRKNREKKAVINKYESYFGKITGGIEDQLWYNEYVSKFDVFPYLFPVKTNLDVNWKLLQRLIAASFSINDYFFEPYGKYQIPNLKIIMKNKEVDIARIVKHLMEFQVQKLFEIFIEEQMNLQSLKMEDSEAGITEQEQINIKNHKLKVVREKTRIRIHNWLNRKNLQYYIMNIDSHGFIDLKINKGGFRQQKKFGGLRKTILNMPLI